MARIPLLQLSEISLTFGGDPVFDNLDLVVQPGDRVALVGRNGSGKSTLLKALIGAVKPYDGSITSQDGLRIGYVPQKLHIDPTLPITVRRFLSLPRRQTQAAIDQALSRVGAPDLQDKQMFALSGGQFQRVLLARALLEEPELLILDEPTTGLDQPGSAAFYTLLEDIKRETGAAVLMVSHELHVVMSASDRVICLNGHVCCHGTPDIVASAPEYRALFGSGTQGALALYRHDHDHSHETDDHEGCTHA